MKFSKHCLIPIMVVLAVSSIGYGFSDSSSKDAQDLDFTILSKENFADLNGEELESFDIGVFAGEQADLDSMAGDGDFEVAAAAGKWPGKKPLKGQKKLLCIGVKYQNVEKAVGQPGCQNLADRVSDFWGRNSRGLIKIEGTGLEPFQVKMNGNKTNYNKAVNMIKASYPGYNYYIIPGIYTNPHAGGKVAHVKSAQYMTATHEVGHLLGLGHAGLYVREGAGYKLKAYNDTDSIMGRVISKFITSPQYYHLGWLQKDEMELYDPKTESYLLKRLDSLSDSRQGLGALIVVPAVIKNNTGKNQVRPAFISATKCPKFGTCVSLHLKSGGGSQKIAEVDSEYYDDHFTGLHVKVIKKPSKTQLRVIVDFEKMPQKK